MEGRVGSPRRCFWRRRETAFSSSDEEEDDEPEEEVEAESEPEIESVNPVLPSSDLPAEEGVV